MSTQRDRKVQDIKSTRNTGRPKIWYTCISEPTFKLKREHFSDKLALKLVPRALDFFK